MPTHRWIVVADSSRARFFRTNGNGELDEVAGLGHPQSRSRSRELTSDRPGRGSDRGGGRHAMDAPTDPHQHEAEVFAREVAQHLRQPEIANDVRGLALVAPPRFLGMLRKSLGSEWQKKVACEIDKNLVESNELQIRAHLPQRW